MTSSEDDSFQKHSAAWNALSERPSQDLIDAAVQATLGHELAIQAQRFVFCHAIVIIKPKGLIERCQWDETTKESIRSKLADTLNVTLVSYHTSTKQPEPLVGWGKTFDFVLHPDTLEILHSSIGAWRS